MNSTIVERATQLGLLLKQRGLRVATAESCTGGLVAAAITAVAGTVAATFVLRWLWPHVERPMRVPVVAYVLVITTMVALAAGAASEHQSWALLVGAVAFYLSDLSVARDRFVAPGFANRVWGLPLYFFAQLLLASQAGR